MKKRIGLMLLVTLCLVLTFSLVAYAEEFTSSERSWSSGSYSYYGVSHMDNFDDHVYALFETGVTTQNQSRVPAGYIGCMPVLFDQGGNVVDSDSTEYNTSSTSWFTSGKLSEGGVSGYVYSRGQAYTWNGNAYDYKRLNATPLGWISGGSKLNVQTQNSLNKLEIEKTKINADGLTYGSAFLAQDIEDIPDLIAVIAENGVKGYINKDDFLGELPKSPEEAVKLSEESITRVVPVFEPDGISKIGEFVISNDDNSSKVSESLESPLWLLNR